MTVGIVKFLKEINIKHNNGNLLLVEEGCINSLCKKIEEVILTVPSGTTSITVDSWKYSVEQIDDTHIDVGRAWEHEMVGIVIHQVIVLLLQMPVGIGGAA